MADSGDAGKSALEGLESFVSSTTARCRAAWTAFTHARADFVHAPAEPVANPCREFTHIQRNCSVEGQGAGRVLHCTETLEKFRLCTDTSAAEMTKVEKLSTTSVETRTPLLAEGIVLVPTRSWEVVQPVPESQLHLASDRQKVQPDFLEAQSSQPLTGLQMAQHHTAPEPAHPQRMAPEAHLAAHSPVERGYQALPAAHPGHPRYRLPGHQWHAPAGDGGGAAPGVAERAASLAAASSSTASCPPQGCEGAVALHPEVEKAVDDLFLFADEMQRDLAQHGLKLMRRGEEQRRPGILARLFGFGGSGEAAGSGSGPYRG